MSIPKKYKKVFVNVLKLIIAILSYGFVIYKIYNSPDIKSFGLFFHNISTSQYLLLTTILILMIVNWCLESLKWKELMKPIQKTGLSKAFVAVWTGVTIGNLTPNRIGEFAGRILFLNKENRKEGTSLTLYGDLAQFIVTLIFGIAGFTILSHFFLNETTSTESINNIILITGITMTVICGLIYFNINNIIKFFKKYKFFQKVLKNFTPAKNISKKTKILTLTYSILRYLVFTFQFFLALHFFDIKISYTNAMLALSSIYLAVHVIPNIPFAELGIRVSFSLLFLGIFSTSDTAILFSSVLIYIINIAIPSLFGGISFIKLKNKT
ncbi:MAG: lysylphosphatidylglycerol synthase domain-containing protein [Bacteroidales bacterium]|nr:lysylphosphatidylglycerol synthase domain-containing protein [Bacteroidales bacterium]MDD4218443.1 lysylphosphatidylglycerol synthase domain-containing protein [Bacteroidales bacterium]